MSRQFVVIGLEEQKFCIPISLVNGIIEKFSITNVPNSLPYVAGVANIRGDIVPVVSLKKIFSIEEKPKANKRLLNVVLSGQNIGFLVDSASQVVTVEEHKIKKMPEITINSERKYLDMAATIENELFIILKLEQLFDENEKKELLSLTEEG